jgi:hypothetical protein
MEFKGSSVRHSIIWAWSLCLLSAPVLFLMLIEVVADAIVYHQYEVVPIYDIESPVRLGSHVVGIKKKPLTTVGLNQATEYEFVFDGKKIQFPATTTLTSNPSIQSETALSLLVDRKLNRQLLVVAQRISTSSNPQIRLIKFTEDGTASEEVFDASGRRSPGYRLIYFRWIGRQPIGFYTDVLQWWPSILDPVVSPFGAFAAGIALFALARLLAQRRTKIERNSAGFPMGS